MYFDYLKRLIRRNFRNRPVSLLSCVGKIMERVVIKYV